MIGLKQIEGLAGWLGSFTAALGSRPQSETIAVTNLADEGIVTHNLDTQELIAHFLIDGRQQQGFDIEPVNDGSIKVYLPVPSQAFTGKIFLLKVT
jgi:hypothetical protein